MSPDQNFDLSNATTVGVLLLPWIKAELNSNVEFAIAPETITGGHETLTYGFQLANAPDELSGPLILRLFRQGRDNRQGKKEAAFQNALAALGYPVPRVFLIAEPPGLAGQCFNIMARVPGHALGEHFVAPDADFMAEIPRLAHIQARLHTIPTQPVQDELSFSGVSTEWYTIWNHYSRLDKYVEQPGLTHLAPTVDWLNENRPSERDTLVVCHGDFQPFNVMMDDGKVSGVIDWPGGAFGDPEYDVAVTVTLMGIIAGAIMPEARPLLTGFTDAYAAAYRERGELDEERLQYYQVLRTFKGYVSGLAAILPGIDPDLLPRDAYPWSDPWAQERGAQRISEITGIAISP
ncbi:MAG: phosphotransferase family protein [Chloroflexi bacterium]|nr:phosphotransferase family protein [Chloroflexota bacterium]